MPHDSEELEGLTAGFEVESGSFGLIPKWSKDDKIARRIYHARSEVVASKSSFRNAWCHGQHCIIPAAAMYGPDWRRGKTVPTRIEHADREVMGVAVL
ncbi:SOS response-associated peptidase family protein [Pseudomonas graminis]|uniref:SOS response-associated peptidase family protein n=1 Tax=Pseudomonas graminis TaxID=158627 RepID=UPI003C276303